MIEASNFIAGLHEACSTLVVVARHLLATCIVWMFGGAEPLRDVSPECRCDFGMLGECVID